MTKIELSNWLANKGDYLVSLRDTVEFIKKEYSKAYFQWSKRRLLKQLTETRKEFYSAHWDFWSEVMQIYPELTKTALSYDRATRSIIKVEGKEDE
jgi:hypothetical protein